MGDLCLRATHKKARLELAVAMTTDLVREAKRVHELGSTSAIALGRLLTGAALLSLTGKQEGSTSIQILSKSRAGTMYADCNHEGHVRGMAKIGHLAFPLAEDETLDGRRSIHLAVYPGRISVVRRVGSGEYMQSSTPLVTGEIDEDLESFLVHSDQIPSLVACDVILDAQSNVRAAAGVLVQAMPDGDREVLARMSDKVARGGLAKTLAGVGEAADLLTDLAPDATHVDQVELAYRCRCSFERVLSSLRMFSVTDLAEMVDEGKIVDVNCDLCGKKYPVGPDELRKAFLDLIKAQG